MLNFIANLKSGQSKTSRTVGAISKYLDKRNVDYKFHFTTHAGHAVQIVKDLESKGADNVIALGGDGTFHEVLNGITDFSKITMGMIPCGSGNDFVQTFKAAKRPLKKLLESFIDKTTAKIDFIQFADGLRSLNVAGTGLDVQVLLKARAYKKLKGKPNYIACLIRVLKNFKPYTVTVTLDGESNTYDCIMAGLCNGRQFGGGIKLSPQSKLDDGKLHLIIMTMVDQKYVKWVLPGFIMGKHLNKPYCVHKIVADRILITNEHGYKVELDGEIYSNLNFDAHVEHKKLSVFC